MNLTNIQKKIVKYYSTHDRKDTPGFTESGIKLLTTFRDIIKHQTNHRNSILNFDSAVKRECE